MGVYKVEERRNYHKPLDLEKYNRITKGATIAVGEGDYPNLIIKDYHGDKRWIASKNVDEGWTMWYGKAKLPYEYIHFNEEKITDLETVQKLIDCTEEVINLYRYD